MPILQWSAQALCPLFKITSGARYSGCQYERIVRVPACEQIKSVHARCAATYRSAKRKCFCGNILGKTKIDNYTKKSRQVMTREKRDCRRRLPQQFHPLTNTLYCVAVVKEEEIVKDDINWLGFFVRFVCEINTRDLPTCIVNQHILLLQNRGRTVRGHKSNSNAGRKFLHVPPALDRDIQ